MNKNTPILIALLLIATAATAQEKKAAAPVTKAPVKQEAAIVTSLSNIKHQGSAEKTDSTCCTSAKTNGGEKEVKRHEYKT